MGDVKRHENYTWVTWVTGLVAGDASCEWAPWFKTRFKHEKREDPDAGNLTQWKADHSLMVRRRADELQAQGWTVWLEEQNSFKVKGEATTVSGKPDIVAVRDAEALVVDCKTGKVKEADYWQVVLYILLLGVSRELKERLAGKQLRGEVEYRALTREVSMADAERGKGAAFSQIRAMGGAVPPRQVPSEGECRRCDIASCTARVKETPAPTETVEF